MLFRSNALGLFGHGYTYSGHPVAAAVALETLAIYQERDIVAQVRGIAPYFQSRIQALAAHPLVGEARGIGLLGALELVADPDTKASYPAADGVAGFLVRRAQVHGLILRSVPGDIVVFSPPLIISRVEIDILFDAVVKALDDTAAYVRGLAAG